MLESIKNQIFSNFSREESKWVFFSLFNKEWKLILSEWVLIPNKNLSELIDNLYYWLVDDLKDQVELFLVDIVLNIFETDLKDLLASSIKEFWFFIENETWTKTWLILPDIEWVADVKNALYLVKKKYEIEWKVRIYKFRTQRFILK